MVDACMDASRRVALASTASVYGKPGRLHLPSRVLLGRARHFDCVQRCGNETSHAVFDSDDDACTIGESKIAVFIRLHSPY
jgi:hypothetical protein